MAEKISLQKKVFFYLIIIFVPVILMVSLIEIIFRTIDWEGNDKKEVAHYIANWEEQWSDDFYVFEKNEKFGVNSDGVRDYEHKVENLTNKYRMAFLGDSVTFGFKLPSRYSYPAILEKLLNINKAKTEVFNVALPGWSPRQSRYAYSKIVKKYHPNHVILAICLNDIAELQNNLSRPPKLLSFAFKYSKFVQFLLKPHINEIHNVEELFHDSKSPKIDSGWKLLFHEILSLSEEVKTGGAKFTVLLFPFRFQVQKNAPDPTPQKKIAAFCKKNGIHFIDLLPVAKEIGESAFVDYDHLSKKGAIAVAINLSESLFNAQR